MASTTIPSIIAGQEVFDADLIHPVYSHEDTNEVIHTFSYIQVSRHYKPTCREFQKWVQRVVKHTSF